MSDKHPAGQPAVDQVLLDSSHISPPAYDPVKFEQVTGSEIKWAALHTQEAAGPSGIDAYGWRRLCSSFGDASVNLCNSLAALARRLATETVDPTVLMAFVACCLIPLDK